MLKAELLDLDYYLNKLSLFMRNSYGVEEQFEMIHQILVRVNTSIDETFEALDVMSENYLSIINSYINNNEDFDILDKIASIYGVSRHFSVTYKETPESVTSTTTELNLTNEELLMLIRARIIQNTYRGSYIESKQFYSLIGLQNQITLLTFSAGVCEVIYTATSEQSNELKCMFLAGLLTLTSMGITYEHRLLDLSAIAIWDTTDWDDTTKKWF